MKPNMNRVKKVGMVLYCEFSWSSFLKLNSPRTLVWNLAKTYLASRQ